MDVDFNLNLLEHAILSPASVLSRVVLAKWNPPRDPPRVDSFLIQCMVEVSVEQ